jgi:hypothetical protein
LLKDWFLSGFFSQGKTGFKIIEPSVSGADFAPGSGVTNPTTLKKNMKIIMEEVHIMEK